ncbi:SDR family oxidoreductase [Actinomadura sp. ATCC 31491]|uniref:SDR family oxidoreductase n=1 Tax=Actinomadura luzonensis TaxID=2805427 RepID=A0ABT0FJY4_9ACTN|nr:SDR family oxidoreductase [Actinomadura luzonensis]MCK2212579.1 SDR family oxidoreductase [Actinomadura luzonensis]
MAFVVTTGATGKLGGRVAARLAAAGVEQRLVSRDAGRAPRLPGASAVSADYGDPEAVRRALDGAGTVLFVSAAESADRLDRHRAFVDAARAAGVSHLVYVSFFGAAPDATFTLARDHWATEQHIRAGGVPFTFLRDNLYADFLPGMAGEDGVIRGPAGRGRVAAVAQDDIADAAVAVLLDPAAHAGATYDLTGPQALTLEEVATVLTAATGRRHVYHEETLDEAYASRQVHGAPGWQVEAWVSTYLAIAAGELDGVSDAVPALTGHPATSLAELFGG